LSFEDDLTRGEFGMRNVFVDDAAEAGVRPSVVWLALEKIDEPNTVPELAPAGVEGWAMLKLP
jgi:hypothetical protein